MMTVFITGATGFIGKSVMREILKCLEPEDKVLVLARKPVEPEDKRVVTILGDLKSLDNVADFIRKADIVLHIAGESRLCGGSDYSTVNVTATQQLVNLAKESGSLERFIYISSVAAMDRSPADMCNEPIKVNNPCFPRTEYGKSKRLAEESILESNLPYTIFRPGYVYGSGMRNDSHLRKFAQLIKKGLPLHRIGFTGRISLIHVDDLASAIVKCLTTDLGINRIYLAETESMPLGDALSLLGKSLYGRQLLQIPVPSMKAVFEKFHSLFSVVVAGMFLSYYWMNDPEFRNEFIGGGQQKIFRDYVGDIIKNLSE